MNIFYNYIGTAKKLKIYIYTMNAFFEGILSFLSAPLIGALSDIWGRKFFLLGRGSSMFSAVSRSLGSGFGLDPDLIRSVDPDSESGSGSRRVKMTHKIRKKIKKFHVLKCWMFSFEG